MNDHLWTMTDEQLIDAMPHGSGIDASWTVDRTKSRITLRCSYHGMEESGMYDGWQDFCVVIRRALRDELNPLKGPCAGQVQVIHRKGDTLYSVHLSGRRLRRTWCCGLLDYLSETIHYAFSELGCQSMRGETITP